MYPSGRSKRRRKKKLRNRRTRRSKENCCCRPLKASMDTQCVGPFSHGRLSSLLLRLLVEIAGGRSVSLKENKIWSQKQKKKRRKNNNKWKKICPERGTMCFWCILYATTNAKFLRSSTARVIPPNVNIISIPTQRNTPHTKNNVFFSGIFAHFFSFCFCHSLALKQNECLYGTFSISLNVRFLKILFCSCATKFVRICGQCVRAVAVLSVRVVAMREGDQAPYSRY